MVIRPCRSENELIQITRAFRSKKVPLLNSIPASFRGMSWEDWKNFSTTLQSFFTCVGILAGGIWAYTRYVRQEENNPYIEFSADVNFIGRQSESWIIEIIGLIENKGKVQHQMTEFQFELDAIYAGDPAELGPSKWQQQAYFGHSVARGSFLSKERQFFFIAPTVKAKYSHITLVPMEARFLLLHCSFKYPNTLADRIHRRTRSHVAEKTVRVPDQESSAG
jgi:hypothetical protein